MTDSPNLLRAIALNCLACFGYTRLSKLAEASIQHCSIKDCPFHLYRKEALDVHKEQNEKHFH